jgi:uncharacterized protein YbcI
MLIDLEFAKPRYIGGLPPNTTIATHIMNSREKADSRERTKGQLEAEISNAVTQYVRDYLGRGPKEARTFIVQDMALVRVRGVLTPAEQQLATESGGIELIKQTRMRLIESSRDLLKKLVHEKVGVPVISMHTDMSARTGDRVFVLVFEENLEERSRVPR